MIHLTEQWDAVQSVNVQTTAQCPQIQVRKNIYFFVK